MKNDLTPSPETEAYLLARAVFPLVCGTGVMSIEELVYAIQGGTARMIKLGAKPTQTGFDPPAFKVPPVLRDYILQGLGDTGIRRQWEEVLGDLRYGLIGLQRELDMGSVREAFETAYQMIKNPEIKKALGYLL